MLSTVRHESSKQKDNVKYIVEPYCGARVKVEVALIFD